MAVPIMIRLSKMITIPEEEIKKLMCPKCNKNDKIVMIGTTGKVWSYMCKRCHQIILGEEG